MGYIMHLHATIAAFIAATAVAVGGLAWYGVRNGIWWALITAVISPVLGLVGALPLHYMGHFNYDWVSHLGPIYLGTIIFVVGIVIALMGLTQAAPRFAKSLVGSAKAYLIDCQRTKGAVATIGRTAFLRTKEEAG